MNKTILPLKRRGDPLSVRRESESPVMEIQNEMNRMFDQFFEDSLGLHSFSPGIPTSLMRSLDSFSPRVNVSETETAVQISAELPGIDEKDIQVSLEGDVLILSGEKKNDVEEKGKNFHRVERSFGSFQRVIPLRSEVDEDKVEAVFKNGVLNITLPKPASAVKETRKITIKPG